MCTEGTPLHGHPWAGEQQPFISTYDTVPPTLSPEKLLRWDRPSMSAMGQLVSTYADAENQSRFPEGRASVTQGH